jgi:hypothetical protein
MNERAESQAQLLAWELKDAAWREVEHLPLDEALRARMKASAATAQALRLPMPVHDPRGPAAPAVREDDPKYGEKKP